MEIQPQPTHISLPSSDLSDDTVFTIYDVNEAHSEAMQFLVMDGVEAKVGQGKRVDSISPALALSPFIILGVLWLTAAYPILKHLRRTSSRNQRVNDNGQERRSRRRRRRKRNPEDSEGEEEEGDNTGSEEDVDSNESTALLCEDPLSPSTSQTLMNPSGKKHPALKYCTVVLGSVLSIGRRDLSHGKDVYKEGAKTTTSYSQRQSEVQLWETLVEICKILIIAAFYGVSVARAILGSQEGANGNHWFRLMDFGVAITALYLIFLNLSTILALPFIRLVRFHQWLLAAGLILILGPSNLLPFAYTSTYHEKMTELSILGFVQTGLAALYALILSLMPPPKRVASEKNDSELNPGEKASALSRMLFSFLESRMVRFYWNPESNPFLSLVPALPSYLNSHNVLSAFRWSGDDPKNEAVHLQSQNRRKQASRDGVQINNTQEDTAGRDIDDVQATIGGAMTFARTFKLEIAQITAFAVIWIVFVFVSPLSMNLLLSYVQGDHSSKVSPYVYVLGIFLAPIFSSISYQNALYKVSQLGLRLRASLGHAVYTKLLRVKEGGEGPAGGDNTEGSQVGSSGDAAGKINNLVGTDIDVITSSLERALELLGVPPKLIVSLVFLYVLLGWSAFVALGTIVAFAPLSVSVSSRYGAVQEEIMKATDRRLNLVGELLSSIRILKIFAWEKKSIERITKIRESELKRITKRAKVYAGMMLLSTGIPMAVTLTTFATYLFVQKNSLTASTAFTSMSLFSLLREAVISSTYLLSSFMRARVSLGRITRFVADTEELDASPRTFEEDVIRIDNAKFMWSKYDTQAFVLYIKSLEFPVGKLSIIAGEVGSGKSALLYALLGEMHLVEGKVIYPVKAATSYSSQSPWLQDHTIKENILFGEEFDEERYEKVLYQCALKDDINMLPDGDETFVGEKGLSISGGQKQRIALARAVYARSDVVLLDDVLSAVDANTVSHLLEHSLDGDLLSGRTVILVTHFVDICVKRLKSCEFVVTIHDGQIDKQMHPQNHLSQNKAKDDQANSEEEDKEEGYHSKDGNDKKKEAKDENPKEDDSSGMQVSWSVYLRYFSAMGRWRFWIVYALINLIAHLSMLGQGYFVGFWVNREDRDAHVGLYFGMYAAIQSVAAVALTAMYLYLIWGSIKASRTLHQKLTSRIFSAPFRFFDTTAQGNIVNRFSKDMETVDTEVVENTQPVFDYAVQVLFVAIIISVILPIFLVPAVIIGLIFFFIGRLYIRNALAARKHVASARSPLFSTLGDTASGAVVIRAFQRQASFATTYKQQTDRYNQMQLYEYGLDRWLEERSDFVGATVSFIVGLLALRAGLPSGTTGFLISTGLEFTSRILFVVRAINKNELSLNSAHRIIQYTEIEQEPQDTEKGIAPDEWPKDGTIEFRDYSARYSPESTDVLKDICLKIRPGEKIGIVGPSGCGKSSIALALLRFIIKSHGEILIDGHPTSEINLSALRSRVTLIPQDPTLFSGTLRSNLDPNDEHEDADLWNALKRSHFVDGGEDGSHGAKNISLDTHVHSGGGNFSQGQRQLLSLCRAMVRSTKILILDEATASLDNETDRLVQKVIREQFGHATNLTIAHRLESIMDFDRVLVLEQGRVKEFDLPRTLLDQKESTFRRMVESTGDFDAMYKLTRRAC